MNSNLKSLIQHFLCWSRDQRSHWNGVYARFLTAKEVCRKCQGKECFNFKIKRSDNQTN